MGCNCLDLDIRGLLHERPRTSSRHGVADPECCQHHLPAILSHLSGQRRLLRVLHVCWNQLLAGGFRLLLHSGD